ncbi:phage minor head protein [Psychrobacter sp. DAB_AL43B]|uniref:phage head morphogenesis protein n=1 Tax=Psychrobacter sp. DAB_AL43B TaxID=1028416 RepID=UPI0009A725B3|nr:phage minor head protein [Psychrobacter sp. DAB_AL43B]SLJ84484.1 phagehead morphogenesis protein [Psychrobacter sp. DAB_AL43B]
MATTTAGFDVQFIEAIAYALNREVVLPDNYYNVMTPIQRQQAVSIAGLAQTEQIKHVMGLVNNELVDGGTFADFQNAVKAGDININLPKHRLDNIFRTNIQGAYGRGRWYQQQQNKDERPYLIRDGINDNRQSLAHRELDQIVRHIDDPFWQKYYAPDRYRCRCVMRALTKEQAEAKGITTDISLPNPPLADGWIGGTPAQYTGNMNQLVNKTIAELAITYYKQSGAILAARQRIESAITAMLAQPIPELAAMIDEAKKLVEEQGA